MNPLMPLIGLKGKGIAYMAKVITRDSTQGMVKIWEIITTRHGKQLARHSWDVVNPGLDKPKKEIVVPKEAETSKEIEHSM